MTATTPTAPPVPLGADDPRRTGHLLILLAISILILILLLTLSLARRAIVDTVAFDHGAARVTCTLDEHDAWRPKVADDTPPEVSGALATICTERLRPAFRLRSDLALATIFAGLAGVAALFACVRPEAACRISVDAYRGVHWLFDQLSPGGRRVRAPARDHSRGVVSVLNAAAFFCATVRTGGIAQSPFFVVAAMVTTMQLNVGLRSTTKHRVLSGAAIFCLSAVIAEMTDGSIEVTFRPVPLTVTYSLVVLIQLAVIEPQPEPYTARVPDPAWRG